MQQQPHALPADQHGQAISRPHPPSQARLRPAAPTSSSSSPPSQPLPPADPGLLPLAAAPGPAPAQPAEPGRLPPDAPRLLASIMALRASAEAAGPPAAGAASASRCAMRAAAAAAASLTPSGCKQQGATEQVQQQSVRSGGSCYCCNCMRELGVYRPRLHSCNCYTRASSQALPPAAAAPSSSHQPAEASLLCLTRSSSW